MSVKIKQGDIFTLSDVVLNGDNLSLNKKIRLGKIIFVSKITRNMIGILISEHIYDVIPNDVSNISFIHKVFYTGNQLLKSGNWDIIGNQNVTEIEEDLTLRIVGCGLRRLDVDLGVVTDSDRKKHDKQGIEGFWLLYDNINDIL